MKYHKYAWILATSALSLVNQNSAGVVLAEKVDGVEDPTGELNKVFNSIDEGMPLRRSYLSYDDSDAQNEVDGGSSLRMLKSKVSKKKKVSVLIEYRNEKLLMKSSLTDLSL